MKTLGIGIKSKKTKTKTFWINVKDDINKYLKDNYHTTEFELIIFSTGD